MTYIPETLRREVSKRAGGYCEYCLLPDNGFLVHEIDHIFAEKHGGATLEFNLCLACYYCNHHKSSDLCSVDPLTGEITPLFHPRRDVWTEHFRLNGGRIEPLTPQGRVTVNLLHLNDPERILDRARANK